MNFIKDFGNQKTTVSLEMEAFSSHVIYFNRDVDAESAKDFLQQLQHLIGEGVDTVTIVIDSPGGDVYQGYAMLDMIEYAKSKGITVKTVVQGIACSMASIFLMAGSEGHRFISPRSMVMIHQPWGQAQGQATEIEIVYEKIMKIKEDMIDFIAKSTGNDEWIIAKDIERDCWLNSEEAVAYGIVDKIGYPEEVFAV